jgi:TonB dependent receptor
LERVERLVDIRLRDIRVTARVSGYKVSLFKQALFFNIDGFYQTRIEAPTNTSGQRAEVHSRGLEIDLDYQPTKQFSFVSNFTYLLANYHQISSAFEQTGNYLDAFPKGFIVDGKSGTGVGSPNFHVFPGNYSLPGTPKIYFNAYAIYKTPWGFWCRTASHRRAESKLERHSEDTSPGYLECRNLLSATVLGSTSEFLQFHERAEFHRDRSDLHWQRCDPATNAVSRLGDIQDQVLESLPWEKRVTTRVPAAINAGLAGSAATRNRSARAK